MKCQHLVGAILMSAAAVWASSLAETGLCPAGYTMTTYVIAVSATPVSESTTGTVSPTAAVSVSSTSASEIPVPETQQTADAKTESSVAAPTTTTVSTTSEAIYSSQTSTSSAQPTSTSSASHSLGTWGEATYYNGIVADGTCSFSGYTLPSSIFGTALSVDMWDHAAKCGACVAITGPNGNTIKAMVSLFPFPSYPPQINHLLYPSIHLTHRSYFM